MRGSALLAILLISFGSGCCCFPTREFDCVRANAEVTTCRVSEWLTNETTKYRCRNEIQSAALKQYLTVGMCDGWCIADLRNSFCSPLGCPVDCEPLVSYPLPTYDQPVVRNQAFPQMMVRNPSMTVPAGAPIMAGIATPVTTVSHHGGWQPAGTISP